MSRFSTPTSMRSALDHALHLEATGDGETADDIRHVVHVALTYIKAYFEENPSDLAGGRQGLDKSETAMLEEVERALR